jgi:Tfp pilus assembly protein PilF
LLLADTTRRFAWCKKGDSNKAMQDCDKALVLDPKLALAYVNRVVVWINKGNMDLACADFRKACELGKYEGMEFCK